MNNNSFEILNWMASAGKKWGEDAGVKIKGWIKWHTLEAKAHAESSQFPSLQHCWLVGPWKYSILRLEIDTRITPEICLELCITSILLYSCSPFASTQADPDLPKCCAKHITAEAFMGLANFAKAVQDV